MTCISVCHNFTTKVYQEASEGMHLVRASQDDEVEYINYSLGLLTINILRRREIRLLFHCLRDYKPSILYQVVLSDVEAVSIS